MFFRFRLPNLSHSYSSRPRRRRRRQSMKKSRRGVFAKELGRMTVDYNFFSRHIFFSSMGDAEYPVQILLKTWLKPQPFGLSASSDTGNDLYRTLIFQQVCVKKTHRRRGVFTKAFFELVRIFRPELVHIQSVLSDEMHAWCLKHGFTNDDYDESQYYKFLPACSVNVNGSET